MQSRFGLAVALAVAGVLAGTLTSTASPPDRSPLEADVSTTAQQMGRSTQEVTSYADGQGTFSQVVGDLSSAHPDDFVDAVWDGPDSRATLIEVHRSILTEARRAAGNQARYVVASDRPSAERRAQIEHEVVEQAATLTEGRHDVSAEVSPDAETVTIVLGGPDAASTANAGARAATAQHLLEGITLPAGVKHVQVTTSSATSGPELGSGGNLTLVRSDMSLKGDSGGLWFWSDRAHGIHVGDCNGVSCFSPISSLSSVDARVYTGS